MSKELEVVRMPVISTAHLTKEVAEILLKQGNDNPWVPCANWEYGHFLYLDDPEAREGEDEADITCLYAIRDWLREQGFTDSWVRLDCDAEPVEGLPTYDW